MREFFGEIFSPLEEGEVVAASLEIEAAGWVVRWSHSAFSSGTETRSIGAPSPEFHTNTPQHYWWIGVDSRQVTGLFQLCHRRVTWDDVIFADTTLMQVNVPESIRTVWDGNEPGVEQTDLITLVKHREQTAAGVPMEQVYQQFQANKHDYCAVLDAGRVVGLCSRGHLGFLMGHRYGFAIYSHAPVREHMVEKPLLLRRGMPVRKALEAALSRQGNAFLEDVILLGREDEYLGIMPVPALVRLQSALVEERFRIQESMHQRLMTVSRQAGMAEVAIGVLHNVGNVLNSVNVSAGMAIEIARNSKIPSLKRVMAMMEKTGNTWATIWPTTRKGSSCRSFSLS